MAIAWKTRRFTVAEYHRMGETGILDEDDRVELLDSMTDADWRRTGTHSESGAYSVERWLSIYGEHAHVHADQIRKNRAGWAARPR